MFLRKVGPTAMTKRANLVLSKTNGLGTLSFGGTTVAVGGKSNFPYPADSMIDPSIAGVKQEMHFSREFGNYAMPWSVLWAGNVESTSTKWANFQDQRAASISSKGMPRLSTTGWMDGCELCSPGLSNPPSPKE